jgi:hypothetical protein
MSGFRNVVIAPEIQTDAGGRLRVSELTKLHDGKVLNEDNLYIWDNQGTGTSVWAANKVNLAVTSGQFVVRQTKRFNPYSSGKSQLVECTFDNFQIQANTVKRVGYFSSNAVSPYASNYDGVWLENDGTTIRLRAARLGVSTADIPWTSWDNYSLISGYNWANFTIAIFDFLWLGGSQLRLFIKTDAGFILAHTFKYAGSSPDTFIYSPNQPVRYEIRSTTGVGSFRYICSAVSVEGAHDDEGYNVSVQSLSTNAIPSNTVATIGTTYPILAVRKKVAFRDMTCRFIGTGLNLIANSDAGRWSIQLNPTLSAPLTFGDLTPVNGIERALGSTTAPITITVTTQGKILASGIVSANTSIQSGVFEKDFLSYLGCSINNTMDVLVLCFTPITASITLNATMTFKEY